MKINPKYLPSRYDSRMLPSTPAQALVLEAAFSMLRFLASMSRRPNAPAKIEIDRMLASWGIELDHEEETA